MHEVSTARWRWWIHWYRGFGLGITWAYNSLIVNLGPLQIEVEHVG